MKKCVFCNEKKFSNRIIDSTKNIIAFFDNNPVTKYHALLITKKHKKSFFNLNKIEISDLFFLLKRVQNKIKKKDNLVKGFNFGANLGKKAGQTIFHCHFHLIPRREGDSDLRLNKKKFFWIK